MMNGCFIIVIVVRVVAAEAILSSAGTGKSILHTSAGNHVLRESNKHLNKRIFDHRFEKDFRVTKGDEAVEDELPFSEGSRS
jgi:hypothetical protein